MVTRPEMSTSQCVVTGANGFLGREIVSRLLMSGVSMSATDISSACSTPGVQYHQADILQEQQLLPVVESASTVIHAAGLAHIFSPRTVDKDLFDKVNAVGTKNMATTAAEAGIAHFILISSVSVYGPFTHGMYSEDNSCHPVGAYAESKYNAELEAQEIAHKSGMALTILRLATLYGERDPGNMVRLIRTLDRGSFFWIGDGSNRKSLLYKADAARACLAVASRPANGVSIYNVSAPPCTMRDIVDGLSMALEKKPLPIRIPAPIALTAGKFISCLPERRLSRLYSTLEKWLAEDVYVTSRIERDYGFHTQIDLIEGLKREVRWYLQNKGKIFQ